MYLYVNFQFVRIYLQHFFTLKGKGNHVIQPTEQVCVEGRGKPW